LAGSLTYAHPQRGVVLYFWEDGKPYYLYQEFEKCFTLRICERLMTWNVSQKEIPKEDVRLVKVTKEDLFDGHKL
jgi:hypothetical protein